MAILKHLTVKNSDYGAAQRYLLFEHESSGKPKLDQDGRMIFRKSILVGSLDCDPFTFNTECTELNRQFQKNLNREDVKAHHYIISFDPRDTKENRLTLEKAHQIGMEYAGYFFDGHQALVVTHSDGGNHSGNLHCHIVLNSLRKRDTARKDFMERSTDALAGYKHHQTHRLLGAMQMWLTEVCEREKLHTVDFSLGADSKINDREYRAKQHGQAELDQDNREIIEDGLTPSRTEFKTIKGQLRMAIDSTARKAKTEAEFIEAMEKEHHIQVRQSRGAWNFIHPDYSRPIRGRSLGRIYEREEILIRLGQPQYNPQYNKEEIPPEYASLPRVFLVHSDLKLVVDIQKNVKAQQSRAYARKVSLSNLQQIARSVVYLQKNGYDSFDALQEDCKRAEEDYQEVRVSLKKAESELREVNEKLHHLGQYLSGKKTYQEFLDVEDKGKYREGHKEVIDSYEQSRSFLRESCGTGPFPTMKELKAQKREIEKRINSQREEANALKKRRNTLRVVQHNIQAVLSRNEWTKDKAKDQIERI